MSGFSPQLNGLRTWIEIDTKALQHNVEVFLKLIPPNTRFMAVVKSNAYGHGLSLAAKALLAFRNFNKGGWFGVDSIVEALRLREDGIKNPILVLGSTLAFRMVEAAQNDIAITISNFKAFDSLVRLKAAPSFHIKIDTGMHRQGFLPTDIPKLLREIKNYKLKIGNSLQGIYTHFAAAKDPVYPSYTLAQLRNFNKISEGFRNAGLRNLIRHSAASGGTILFPESHLDMIRIGIGLYGYWPSLESKMQFSTRKNRNVKSEIRNLSLQPVLTWKTVVSEIKEIPKGSYVGYDLAELVSRRTKFAVLPVGYWHGYDRGLSGIGEILIRGVRRRVLGRISMDMAVVDVTESPFARVGDEAVLIGRQGKESIWADELSQKIGTSPYEVLTRINPLIERVVK